MLKLQKQSFESCGDSSFSSSISSERLSRRKSKENQEEEISKTFKELCQTEVLNTNIGKGKETSNEEVEGGVRGKQIDDSFNAKLD